MIVCPYEWSVSAKRCLTTIHGKGLHPMKEYCTPEFEVIELEYISTDTTVPSTNKEDIYGSGDE